jgi:murein DD-endopeptidase MepM/ murein hydrolase activator NlpD
MPPLQQILVKLGLLIFGTASLAGLGWLFLLKPERPAVAQESVATAQASLMDQKASLPVFIPKLQVEGIPRLARIDTKVPKRPNVRVQQYVVKKGDTPWSIGEKFGLQPESILWGNDGLSAEAGSLTISMTLNILPTDGVLHTVVEGDTLEGIASQYGVSVETVRDYIGNDFPLVPPLHLVPGQQVIVPGGTKPIAWQDPGPAVIAGMGRKSPGFYSGNLVNIGTGYFIWPVAEPIVLTQQFWGGHPAIDIDTYYRQPIFAADSGTVIFSGWSTSGYGNLVIVDHGNGMWTYYAHNSFNLVSEGQGVFKGQQVAESGSTGNSTGDHLDFRIRVDGGSFLNPMDFLP